jgi:hypothetical protein
MRSTATVLSLFFVACVDAHAQPQPRRDAGLRDRPQPRDVTRDASRDVPRSTRDAGVRRDAADANVVRPPTHGRIDANAARRTLATRNDAVRTCYEREVQRDPTLRGEITVRLRVEDDGAVSETSAGGDPSLLRVGRCIEEALRTLTFPRPTGGPATVAAPFVFQPGE